jgi:hypothetical protein
MKVIKLLSTVQYIQSRNEWKSKRDEVYMPFFWEGYTVLLRNEKHGKLDALAGTLQDSINRS